MFGYDDRAKTFAGRKGWGDHGNCHIPSLGDPSLASYLWTTKVEASG